MLFVDIVAGRAVALIIVVVCGAVALIIVVIVVACRAMALIVVVLLLHAGRPRIWNTSDTFTLTHGETHTTHASGTSDCYIAQSS